MENFIFLCSEISAFRRNFQLEQQNGALNPLSAIPSKSSNTLKQFVACCRRIVSSVLDHFVGLSLKELIKP